MNSVVKGASYILAYAPDMVLHNGTTQTTERAVNPDSQYLKDLPSHLRSFDEFTNYLPNQTYIGNMTPDELAQNNQPWYEIKNSGASRFGKMGEIMPQDEFYLLMQVCDVFDLVKLESSFVEKTRPVFEKHPLMGADIIEKLKEGISGDEIKGFVEKENAEPLYHENVLIGCVKKAHDIDETLAAHVIHENLVSKASCVLSLLNLVKTSGISKDSIDYVIDCSEEACGDINQRGGGNFAKASAEMAGLSSASGADIRAFCAAPAHAIIHAAALVASGTYENVVVAAGGSTAKLGMNAKEHVKKGLPVMEDAVAGFAVLVSKNDGVSPEICSEYTGRHKVGSGSSPQAVITALVADPLDKYGMKITDIDKYSVEMQNPDITKTGGAGDVPLANYKMIGALSVKRGELEKKELATFPQKHGMVGWAPTQGHIPSGVPYVGFAIEDIKNGKINNTMVIGKGSLFLGRMTNQFDGVSFIMQKNSGAQEENSGVSKDEIRTLIAQAMRDFAQTLIKE